MTFEPNEIENLVWSGDTKNKRDRIQWMDAEFYDCWMKAMSSAFYVLGMDFKYQELMEENVGEGHQTDNCIQGFVPVQGWRNRQCLGRTMGKMKNVSASFELVPVQGGTAVRYLGDRRTALKEWQEIMELVERTTVVALVTPGLQYYVEGTQVGYMPATRHLFRRGNRVQRIGFPYELKWEANVSGYQITIRGDWDEIKRTGREMGLNIFQMLQLRINEEMEEAFNQV